MATYVLVHGGGHGGWCYRMAPLLRAKGHDVYTPTLTGLGERRTWSAPTSTSTPTSPTSSRCSTSRTSRRILVGHSYGGMVITGMADRAPTAIGQLVFLDAAGPANGQSLVDVAPAL